MSLALSLCVVLFLIISLPIWRLAQGSARVDGLVSDPSGAVVSGAAVTLTHSATGQTHSMTTSPEGRFTFLDLPPGAYDLNVKAQGFKTFAQTGITVQVGHAVTTNVT